MARGTSLTTNGPTSHTCAGLRPVQIWVPAVRSKAFKAEAHRQSLALAESAHDEVDEDFIHVVSDLEAP